MSGALCGRMCLPHVLARSRRSGAAVLRIYRYHTGMDPFSDYISVVLGSGIQKWYERNSDYNSSFAPCLAPRSPPTLPELIVFASRNASFTTLPPVNEPKFITHPSVLLKDTHDPSNIPTSTRKHQGIPRVGSLPPHRPESGNTTFCGMHTTSDYARAADLITLREPYREILNTAQHTLAKRNTVEKRAHAKIDSCACSDFGVSKNCCR